MNSRFALSILAALLLSAQAAAQNRPQREMPGRMMEQLNLTDDQQKQFDALASAFRKDMVDRRAEIAKARLELLDLLKAESPNQAQITDQLVKVGNLESTAKSGALGHWFAVNKILTPEQQKLWKKGLMRMARQGMAERMRRGARSGGRMMERPGRPLPPPR